MWDYAEKTLGGQVEILCNNAGMNTLVNLSRILNQNNLTEFENRSFTSSISLSFNGIVVNQLCCFCPNMFEIVWK